jgi:kynurenine formamidase
MKLSKSALALMFVAVVSFAWVGGAGAEDALWTDQWWPSKWGAEDERGSFNTLTPDIVAAAAQLVKSGKVYRLGMPYSADMPLFGKRTFSLTIPGLPVGGPFGQNQVIWNDEVIFGELGQVGTQFDGLGHIGIRGENGTDRWYNGRELANGENSYGLVKNGVEKLGPCITRGVLIDLVGLKGVESMEKGEIITVADIESAIAKAGIKPIGTGDAVLVNTGWGKYWGKPEIFNAGCPGIGVEAAHYLIDRNVSLVCADTWPIEAIPGDLPDHVFHVHQLMQTVNGVMFIENLNTDVMSRMAKEGVYEFMFVFVPVPFVGATGSPGDVVAVR